MRTRKRLHKLNNIPLYFFTCVRVIISWFINLKHEINERRTKISSTGGDFTVSQWARFEKVDSQRGYLISQTDDGFFP